MGIIAQAQPYLPQTVTHWAVAVAVSWIGYWTSVYFYRLFFHPLRKIPGPWYAAATYWYEFYQDVILGGNYVKDYPRIHAKYGRFFHAHRCIRSSLTRDRPRPCCPS